jgi:predicted ATPase
VLKPIPEWIEDDGVRSLDDPTNYYTQLCELLTELGIWFVDIGEEIKDLSQRVQFVLDHLCQWKRKREVVSTS